LKSHRTALFQGSTHSGGPSAGAGWTWFLLVAVIVAVAAIRVPLLSTPLERDEGEYAYVARLLLDGFPPYERAYSIKLPGVAMVYAPFVSLLGETPAAIHVCLLLANAATILGMFLLGRKVLDPLSGLLAAACFAVLSLGRGVQGLFANTEHFVVLFAVFGLLLLPEAPLRRPLRAFASGLLLGGSILMKQHGAFFAAFGGLYLLLAGRREDSWRLSLAAALPYAAGVALPPTLLLGWCAWRGVTQDFWFWSFTYAREYLSYVSFAEGIGFGVVGLAGAVGAALPVWLLAGAGLVALGAGGGAGRSGRFLGGLALASALAVLPAFRFRPHYFVYLLPVVSLLAAVGASALVSRVTGRLRGASPGAVSGVLIGTVLLGVLGLQRDYLFRMTPEEVSVATYGANPFPEAVDLARRIRESTTPDERIAVVASEPEIYFYAHRHSATPYLYLTELLRAGPRSLHMQRDLIAHVERAEPRYVVLSSRFNPFARRGESGAPLFAWVRKLVQREYRRVGVVEIRRDAPSVSRFGEEARKPPRTRDWLMLYERMGLSGGAL
jgi:hypothetical protein